MRLVFALAALWLGACAVLQPGPAAVDTIVAEAMATSRAPAAEQQATLARAEKAAAAGTPADRLRLATLLATLPAPLRDDARAAKLLAPLADPAAPGVGRFAALLSAQLAERQRLAGELERTARERERVDKERDRREETLKQQLEALRAIERGILEREESLRRRQR